MTRRTLAVAFVTLLLSLALIWSGRAVASASTFFVTGAVWGSPANPVEAEPGDRNVPLTVTLQYSDTDTATSIHAELELPNSFTDINGAQTAFAYTGGVAPNSYFSLVFNLNIAADAVIGKYTMTLDISWSIGSGYSDESVPVPVNLKGKADITFSAQPIFLNAGQVNNITIKISNQGTGNAYQVKTSISAPREVILLNQLPQISRLRPQISRYMNLIVYVSPTAAGSPISISLTVTYKDAYLNSRSLTCTLGFVAGYTSLTVSRVFWGSSAVPIEVQPGDNNQPLTVVIVNSGTVLAQNVTASLIIESPFSYQYTSGGDIIEATNETSSVGTIMPGGSGLAQFTLSIGANSTSGLYKLKMMLEYLGNSPTQTTVDIPVRGYSDMALQSVSVLPPKVYPGDKNLDLKVFVTNAGNAAAKNVSVEIVQAQYVRPSWGGADSFFIGTVQPGQIVPVDFYIDVYESAPSPSNHTLIAKIVYGPTRNIEKSEEIPLFLSAKSRFVVTSTKIPEIHVSDTGIVILVTFKNIGAEAAQGARVEIEVPNVFSGTTSDYLGTVKAGEEKTASFVLNIDPNAKIGSYVLNQRMSWSQAGATHLFTQDLGLELNILENPLSKLLPSIIIILLVIVAAVIFVVAARRRSHSSKMQPKQHRSEDQ